MESVSLGHPLNGSRSSLHVPLPLTSRGRCFQSLTEGPNSFQKKNHGKKRSRFSPVINQQLIEEALGFIIRSSQVRGKECKLLCSRYVFKTNHAESFKKSMTLLKELGYIESRDRNCAKVSDRYRNLHGLEIALKRDFDIDHLPNLPALNLEHYLVTNPQDQHKESKSKKSMMLQTSPQNGHNWERESEDNKNLKLLELCKIVYDIEKETIEETTDDQELLKKVSQSLNPNQTGSKKQKLNSDDSPTNLNFILNPQSESSQIPKLPPLHTICNNTMTDIQALQYAAAFQPVNFGSFPHLYSFGNFIPMPPFQSQRSMINQNIHIARTQSPVSDRSGTSSSETDSIETDDRTIDHDRSSEIDNSSDIRSKMFRKSRRTVTNEERDVLEKFYSENPYPTRQKYDEIRRKLGWNSSRRVTKWFNNRRYNEKNKQ